MAIVVLIRYERERLVEESSEYYLLTKPDRQPRKASGVITTNYNKHNLGRNTATNYVDRVPIARSPHPHHIDSVSRKRDLTSLPSSCSRSRNILPNDIRPILINTLQTLKYITTTQKANCTTSGLPRLAPDLVKLDRLI